MTTYPSWPDAAPDFARDGSLRDIYVLDATVVDWERVLEKIRGRYSPLRFTVDGHAAEMPERVADIFALWERGTAPLLSFDVAGILVTCHFFAPEEIEFSIDPGDVTGQDSLDAIAALLHELASAIKKPALLTPENLPKSPILRAEPESDRVELLPPSPEQSG